MGSVLMREETGEPRENLRCSVVKLNDTLLTYSVVNLIEP